MWLDILACVLAVGITAFFSVYLYRLGLRDGKEPQAVFLPMVSGPSKPSAMEPPEIARMKDVLQNIDNYDGTNRGQVKIDG